MKKILLLIGVLTLAGCQGYFDVKPRTEVRAEDIFKTEEGYWDALTGLYIGMTDQSVYGRNLSWDAIEFMAWNHINRDQSSGWFYLQRADYGQRSSKQFAEMVWSKLYNVIAEANYLLHAVDEWGGHLSDDVRRTVRGEALAIRAYCHFDLLRLYAPVPNDTAVALPTIPYVTRYEKHVPVQRTYSATLGLLRTDIDEALRLLDERTLPEDRRLYRSNTHMNWAAMQLLKARVGQWTGDANTLQYAQTLIDYLDAGASKWALDQTTSQAAIMPSEVLFGLNVWKLKQYTQTSWTLYPSSAHNDNMLLSPTADFVPDDLFQQNNQPLGTPDSDIRFSAWFAYFNDTQHSVTGRTSVKIRNTGSNANSLVPLLRMSEAWLIAADASPREQAIGLVNTLRGKRAISPAGYLPLDTPESDVRGVIEHELRREFTQEGQTWFLYKRLGKTRIPGMEPSVNDMTAEKYTLPYPETDIEFGIKP